MQGAKLRTAPPRSDGSRLIYYITERGSANQYFLLANARNMRVFNCAEPFAERFLKRYAEMAEEVRSAIAAWAGDVRNGSYPDAQHSF